MNNVIELRNVSKTFKGFEMKDINLDIKTGYITGFIGGNGAGKSTTIKMIMNLIKPDSGDIKVFGLDYSSHEKEIKERIGFVYDSNVFFEGLNLRDIKHIVAPAYKKWDDRLFSQYTDQFELPLNKSIKHFSKGMQMKASLALALSHHSELIIMDEPTAGLDPMFRRELLQLLQSIMLDEKRTILFSTHITTDLDRIADYIVLMQSGQVKFNETFSYLSENFFLIKGDLTLLDRDTEQYFIHIERGVSTFSALTNNITNVVNLFGDTVVVEPANLEDIMCYLKGAKEYV